MNYKYFFLTTLIISFSLICQAQSQANMFKQKGKYHFQITGYDAERLDTKKPLKSFVDILNDNKEAAVYANRAKSNYDTGAAIAFIGGGIMGWELGKVIGGNELNPAVFGSGVAIALFSIPLASSFNKNMEKAIEIYNGENTSKSLSLNFGIQSNGFGLALNF